MVRYRLFRCAAQTLRALSLPFIAVGLIASPILALARHCDARAWAARPRLSTGPPGPPSPAEGDRTPAPPDGP